MAFDRTSQDDLNTLKTEIETDPLNVGYQAQSGNTSRILERVNGGEFNPGPEVVTQRLTPKLLIDACVNNATSLTVGGQFTQGELEALKLIVEASATLEDDIEEYRLAVESFWQANDPLRQALEAQTRKQSRAEVLFGIGTTISSSDWFAARDNGVIL